MIITSRANERVKAARALQQHKEREASGLHLIEGDKLVLDAIHSGAEIETGTLNGFPCVTYEVPANKTINAAFTTQAGYVLEFAMGPINDDNAKIGASLIMASIQAAE